MKKNLMMALLLGSTLGSAIGCARNLPGDLGNDDNDTSTRREPRRLFSGEGFVSALGGRLDGAIGPAVGLSGNAETLQFWDDGMSTSANLTVRGENGSGMGILYMSGGVQALEVGETVRTCGNDYMDPEAPANNGAVVASFTGCANSGAPEDGWSYDEPAECTDVEITEPDAEAPPDTVATMNVLAHWSAAYGSGLERTVKATIHLTE